MKGKFIVFEGLDGSGTSTQANLLGLHLKGIGVACHLTSEPSSGPIGTMIRQIFSGRISMASGRSPFHPGDLFDQQMAYLFAADRHDHLYNPRDGILELLSAGTNVISTRYYFSSLAYHASTESDLELAKRLNQRFPPPDLVIYLENDPLCSVSRIEDRIIKDTYENTEKLSQAQKNYATTFSEYTGRILRIDAKKDKNQIHQIISKTVGELLGN